MDGFKPELLGGVCINGCAEITDAGRLVASVQKQWFTWGDTYEISVDDRLYDPAAVLAVAIIIDCVLDSQDN